MPTNSEGGIERATDLCEVYALVARKSSNFFAAINTAVFSILA
jgi:hypothetical protein